MEVIDLCSGDGWFTLPIAEIARHVVAIDIDPDLLEGARRRLAKTEMPYCDFVAGDANELPALVQFPADFVFMANAFHGVSDRPRLAYAVRAALKPAATSRSSTGIGARARRPEYWANRVDPPMS